MHKGKSKLSDEKYIIKSDGRQLVMTRFIKLSKINFYYSLFPEIPASTAEIISPISPSIIFGKLCQDFLIL